ncbi:MAG: AEC family transporter [Prevotellaceae bacterium]|jgi:predicted permease|nr:AEC family transporter [Prevotellaceae bacterium]
MTSFLFSINCVAPIFLIIALGVFLKRRGLLPQPVVDVFNTIAFNVALPLLLFRDVALSDIRQLFAPTFILYAIGATIVGFSLTWALAERYIKDKTTIGAFVQGSFRGNYAIIGLFLIINILGHSGKGALITAFAIPLYNILAVVVLSARSKNPQPIPFRRTLLNIAKNPLIIGIAAGAPFSIWQIPLFTHPQTHFIAATIDSLAAITNPLALLAIGASISRSKLRTGWPKAAIATTIKLVISPAIFTTVAYLWRQPLGFTGEDILVLMIMFAVPTAVASYIMAAKMHNDQYLAANIVLLTSLFSLFTLTAGIYLLKSTGII